MLYALTFAAVMAYWIGALIARRAALPPMRLVVPITAFVTYLLGSALWSLAGGTTLSEWLRGIAPFVNLLLVFPAYAAITVPSHRSMVVVLFVSAALLLAVQTFAGVIAAIPDVMQYGNALFIRAHLPPQAYSALIVAGAAYALGEMLLSPRNRLIHVGVFTLLMAALSATFLRVLVLIFGTLLMVGVTRMVAMRASRRTGTRTAFRSWRLVVGIVLLGGVAALFVPPLRAALDVTLGGYLDRFLTAPLADGNSRIAEAEAVFQHFLFSPVFGNGPGYEYAYLRPELGEIWIGSYTHNLFTYAILVGGMLGLVLAIWLVVSLMRAAWRGESSIGGFAHGPAFAIYALIVYGLFQASFRTLGFWLVLAVFVSVLSRSHSSFSSSADAAGRHRDERS